MLCQQLSNPDFLNEKTIHNLAGDVQPCEMYDAILHADALGHIALGK